MVTFLLKSYVKMKIQLQLVTSKQLVPVLAVYALCVRFHTGKEKTFRRYAALTMEADCNTINITVKRQEMRVKPCWNMNWN